MFIDYDKLEIFQVRYNEYNLRCNNRNEILIRISYYVFVFGNFFMFLNVGLIL